MSDELSAISYQLSVVSYNLLSDLPGLLIFILISQRRKSGALLTQNSIDAKSRIPEKQNHAPEAHRRNLLC